MKKIIEYIKEVIEEGKRVSWPTKKQTFFFTVAVFVVSVIIAYYLGLLDYVFGQGLNLLLTK